MFCEFTCVYFEPRYILLDNLDIIIIIIIIITNCNLVVTRWQ